MLLTNPIRSAFLKLVRGAWNDTKQIRDCELLPNGPTYVMDRGFYSLVTMAVWLQNQVRFIVRAKAAQCHHRLIKRCGKPRNIGNVIVKIDGIAVVGKDPDNQVTVRLVWCEKDGKDLILVSSLLDASADDLLGIYKKRWVIERFHKVVKHVLGLAHLYSFQSNGLELLVYIAFILAVLVYMSSPDHQHDKELVRLLRSILKTMRRELGLTDWKPNICTHGWTKKRSQNH
jgi:hypothetical protein